MKKFKFEVVGTIEQRNYEGDNYVTKEPIYKSEEGIHYIQNSGNFSAYGVVNDFTPLKDCEIVDDYIIVGVTGNINGTQKNVIKLYNAQIELTNKKWGVSYGKLKELNIKDLIEIEKNNEV